MVVEIEVYFSDIESFDTKVKGEDKKQERRAETAISDDFVIHDEDKSEQPKSKTGTIESVLLIDMNEQKFGCDNPDSTGESVLLNQKSDRKAVNPKLTTGKSRRKGISEKHENI